MSCSGKLESCWSRAAASCRGWEVSSFSPGYCVGFKVHNKYEEFLISMALYKNKQKKLINCVQFFKLLNRCIPKVQAGMS